MANETRKYSLYLINERLIEMFGLPKNSKGKNYSGYYSMIYKWMRKDYYDLKYIWFVVDKIYQRFRESGDEFTMGYFIKMFDFCRDEYDPNEVKLPHSATREQCLKSGHTIDTLPFHLLTKEEKKIREQGKPIEEEVTEEDIQKFKEFFNNL